MMSCDLLQDILYCYPTEARDWGTSGEDGGREGVTREGVRRESGEGVRRESSEGVGVTGLLMSLRGVFLTLSDVMSSITADAHSW